MLSSDQISNYKRGLFFIVGNSRGGTTLLQAILSSHSHITIPPETHFFYYLPPLRRKFGEVLHVEHFNALVDELFETRPRASDLKLDRDGIKANFKAFGRNYSDLFVVLLSLYASERGKLRFGEKTPRHIFKVPELSTSFPEARFITLLRDPRSVACSELNASYSSPSVYVTSRRWRRTYDMHIALSQALPESRYMMLRYEDLVQEPQKEVDRICAFLGEEFEPEMLRFYNRSEDERGYPEKETWKTNTLKPINKSRIDAWREQLDPSQVAIIERTVGHRLELMGYSPAGIASPHPAIFYTSWAKDIFASLQATFRKRILRSK